MRLKNWLVLGVVLPVLGAGALAFADPPGGPGGPGAGQMADHPGQHFGYIIQQLNLTPDQQKLVDDAKAQMRSHFEQMRAERQKARQTLQDQFANGNPDPTVLHDLIAQRASEQEQFAHDRLDAFLKLYATLTPEQKQTVKDLLGQAPQGRFRHFRGGPRPGFGPGSHPGFGAGSQGNQGN